MKTHTPYMSDLQDLLKGHLNKHRIESIADEIKDQTKEHESEQDALVYLIECIDNIKISLLIRLEELDT